MKEQTFKILKKAKFKYTFFIGKCNKMNVYQCTFIQNFQTEISAFAKIELLFVLTAKFQQKIGFYLSREPFKY